MDQIKNAYSNFGGLRLDFVNYSAAVLWVKQYRYNTEQYRKTSYVFLFWFLSSRHFHNIINQYEGDGAYCTYSGIQMSEATLKICDLFVFI